MSKFRNIVILTGAGMSAETGLGTFRGKGGVSEKYRVEDVATPGRFSLKIQSAYTGSTTPRRRAQAAQPNAAHLALARLEREHGRVLAVTQNIDALHEAAGSKNLIHMHGELDRALCTGCEVSMPGTRICRSRRAARLRKSRHPSGRGLVGEMPHEMERIYGALARSELFISIGTSGKVYPAAASSLEARAAGAHTVELNLEPSEGADLFLERIEGPATEIVPAYVDRLLAG